MAAEDPGLIPGEVIMLSGFVGWTVALRYWAASLDARAAGEMSRVASTDSALRRRSSPFRSVERPSMRLCSGGCSVARLVSKSGRHRRPGVPERPRVG